MSDLAQPVLDALPYTIYTVDLDGTITSVNRAWSRFAEANGAPEIASVESVRGRHISAGIADAAQREQIERGMEILRTGRAEHVTWEFPCDSPDEQRVFLMQLSPLHEGHTITGFVFSTVDITVSHRSREALIEIGTALSRPIDLGRLFQDVAHEIRRAVPYEAIAIAITNPATEDLRIAHRSGYEEDDVSLATRLGESWREAFLRDAVLTNDFDPPSDAMEITVPMTVSGARRGAMTVVTEALDSVQRLHEAERILLTIASQTAVAIERAELVGRVKEKRRLEAVGEVAAGVAHELRNPLFGISSAAQLLRFRAREDPVVERNVGRILREVERLNMMVTDLLEFGRPRPLQRITHDPDDVWDEVLEGNRGLLERRSLSLRRDRPIGNHTRWSIDAERMKQVFLNVLVNAVDASPEGEEIALQSHVLATGVWRCTLRNGGDPIPPDVLPRVFELFMSNKSGGTGIGLALCQRIMDEHGGTIGIDSTAKLGTTVTITVPPFS